jgi:hypothetical protein
LFESEFRAVREIEIAPALDADRPGPATDRSTDRRTLASTGDRSDHRHPAVAWGTP